MRCLWLYFVWIWCNLQVVIVLGQTSQTTQDPEKTSNNDNDNDRRRQMQNENTCSEGESHVIIDNRSSCCARNVSLTHGIDLSKYWKECAVQLTSTPSQSLTQAEIQAENYVDSVRRVYSCILSKYFRKDTVDFLSFANLMTVNYPVNIKNLILKSAKLQRNLSAEVPLSDYEGVRKLRIIYFEIQRNVCISIDTASEVPRRIGENNSTSGGCDESEEAELTGGSCCKNKSVPIDLDFWRSRPLKYNQCNETLESEFKRWNIQNSELDTALDICTEACELKQEGVISYQDLIKERTLGPLNQKDMREEINRISPPYLSSDMLNTITKYSEKHFNLTKFENEIAKHHHLSQQMAATFRPCIYFHRTADVIYDALHSYCFPSATGKTQYIQQ